MLHIGAYYDDNGQTAWLLERGESEAAIGYHAGIRDTSELMHVYPEGVREDRLASPSLRFPEAIGTDGDPSRADAETGARMLQFKIDAIVDAIQRVRAEQR